MSLSLPTLETGSRPFYYIGKIMHLASRKIIFCAVSTRGKLDPHVAPPISLTISNS